MASNSARWGGRFLGSLLRVQITQKCNKYTYSIVYSEQTMQQCHSLSLFYTVEAAFCSSQIHTVHVCILCFIYVIISISDPSLTFVSPAPYAGRQKPADLWAVTPGSASCISSNRDWAGTILYRATSAATQAPYST